jgi:hypothetical protein
MIWQIPRRHHSNVNVILINYLGLCYMVQKADVDMIQLPGRRKLVIGAPFTRAAAMEQHSYSIVVILPSHKRVALLTGFGREGLYNLSLYYDIRLPIPLNLSKTGSCFQSPNYLSYQGRPSFLNPFNNLPLESATTSPLIVLPPQNEPLQPG